MPQLKYIEEDFKYTKEEIDLINKYENMVYKVWSLLANNWIKHSYRNELISAGLSGLCYAAKLYDKSRGSFETYCAMYIRSKMYIVCRKIIRESKIFCSLDEPVKSDRTNDNDDVLGNIIPSDTNVEEEAIYKVTVEEIKQAVEAVCTERQKELLNMYCEYFMSYSEIAEALGISRERVRQLFEIIRKKVLKKYEYTLDN